MAFLKIHFFLFISALFLHATLAHDGVVCERLPTNKCAFAVAASGKRCLLEANDRCVTSEVVVDHQGGLPDGFLESDECISACGLSRNTVGMSSDALLDPKFTLKLCSHECRDNCPNIKDLYMNLAAGEGAFLPAICDALSSIPQRSMVELLSSGGVIGGKTGAAPAPAPK